MSGTKHARRSNQDIICSRKRSCPESMDNPVRLELMAVVD
jgi:hypothetical protein